MVRGGGGAVQHNGSGANGRPTFSGTGDPGSTVIVTITDDAGMEVEELTVVVGEDGTWSVDVSADLPEGDYGVGVDITDPAGNTSSLSTTFDIDQTAPAVEVISPASDSITANTQPAFSGTSEPGSEVIVTLRDANGDAIATQTVTADPVTGAWSADFLTMDLENGAYTVDVDSTDAAGNTSSASSSFTVDTTALPLEITNIGEGESINDDTPELAGTTAPGATVTVTITNEAGEVVSVKEVTADENGDWSVELDDTLPEGNYTATATVESAAGVESTASTGFTIDTSAPDLMVDEDQFGPTNDTTPNISGTGEPGAQITVTVVNEAGEVVQTITTTADENGDWSVELDELGEGDFDVNIEATDAAGNSSMASGEITVDTSLSSTTLGSPADGSVLSEASPEFSGDAEPGAQVTVVIKDAEGNEVATITTTANESGEWSVSGNDLGEGEYTVEVSASDAAGNEESLEPVTITIDLTDPEVTIDEPGEEDPTTIGGEGEPGTEVEIIIDGESAGEVIVGEDGKWSFELPEELEPGDHDVKVIAEDAAGNTSEVEATVTLDGDDAFILAGGTADGGCACGSTNSDAPNQSWLGLLLLGFAGMWRRRKKD